MAISMESLCMLTLAISFGIFPFLCILFTTILVRPRLADLQEKVLASPEIQQLKNEVCVSRKAETHSQRIVDRLVGKLIVNSARTRKEQRKVRAAAKEARRLRKQFKPLQKMVVSMIEHYNTHHWKPNSFRRAHVLERRIQALEKEIAEGRSRKSQSSLNSAKEKSEIDQRVAATVSELVAQLSFNLAPSSSDTPQPSSNFLQPLSSQTPPPPNEDCQSNAWESDATTVQKDIVSATLVQDVKITDDRTQDEETASLDAVNAKTTEREPVAASLEHTIEEQSEDSKSPDSNKVPAHNALLPSGSDKRVSIATSRSLIPLENEDNEASTVIPQTQDSLVGYEPASRQPKAVSEDREESSVVDFQPNHALGLADSNLDHQSAITAKKPRVTWAIPLEQEAPQDNAEENAVTLEALPTSLPSSAQQDADGLVIPQTSPANMMPEAQSTILTSVSTDNYSSEANQGQPDECSKATQEEVADTPGSMTPSITVYSTTSTFAAEVPPVQPDSVIDISNSSDAAPPTNHPPSFSPWKDFNQVSVPGESTLPNVELSKGKYQESVSDFKTAPLEERDVDDETPQSPSTSSSDIASNSTSHTPVVQPEIQEAFDAYVADTAMAETDNGYRDNEEQQDDHTMDVDDVENDDVDMVDQPVSSMSSQHVDNINPRSTEDAKGVDTQGNGSGASGNTQGHATPTPQQGPVTSTLSTNFSTPYPSGISAVNVDVPPAAPAAPALQVIIEPSPAAGYQSPGNGVLPLPQAQSPYQNPATLPSPHPAVIQATPVPESGDSHLLVSDEDVPAAVDETPAMQAAAERREDYDRLAIDIGVCKDMLKDLLSLRLPDADSELRKFQTDVIEEKLGEIEKEQQDVVTNQELNNDARFKDDQVRQFMSTPPRYSLEQAQEMAKTYFPEEPADRLQKHKVKELHAVSQRAADAAAAAAAAAGWDAVRDISTYIDPQPDQGRAQASASPTPRTPARVPGRVPAQSSTSKPKENPAAGPATPSSKARTADHKPDTASTPTATQPTPTSVSKRKPGDDSNFAEAKNLLDSYGTLIHHCHILMHLMRYCDQIEANPSVAPSLKQYAKDIKVIAKKEQEEYETDAEEKKLKVNELARPMSEGARVKFKTKILEIKKTEVQLPSGHFLNVAKCVLQSSPAKAYFRSIQHAKGS
ncbi:hypothetical protein LTR05_006525 [Lithohypha guttulata]|uniref:Uncharacterized protein n=1 Tax=Lithohypha guttulata TaxID=1690604 RepID=A0AAN7YDY1_9EURO|nr:hypothetical protein LTR05_006525 [Lithohypha guttulata]